MNTTALAGSKLAERTTALERTKFALAASKQAERTTALERTKSALACCCKQADQMMGLRQSYMMRTGPESEKHTMPSM